MVVLEERWQGMVCARRKPNKYLISTQEEKKELLTENDKNRWKQLSHKFGAHKEDQAR